LYPWYIVFSRTMAWLPVFFLFFSQHLSLEQVLQLEALYYLSVVLLEVPSGYFSDAIGRRPTLLISSIALALAYAVFLIGDNFPVFASSCSTCSKERCWLKNRKKTGSHAIVREKTIYHGYNRTFCSIKKPTFGVR